MQFSMFLVVVRFELESIIFTISFSRRGRVSTRLSVAWADLKENGRFQVLRRMVRHPQHINFGDHIRLTCGEAMNRMSLVPEVLFFTLMH